MSITSQFQSTLPVWGGTVCVWLVVDTAIGFNPPSPCGEGPGKAGKLTIISEFQSTLPVWGGTCQFSFSIVWMLFQSTLPVWGGTKTSPAKGGTGFVSIHPPRVGRDRQWLNTSSEERCFNPPSPCGEGPKPFTLSFAN